MKSSKRIGIWIVVGLLAVTAIGGMPSFSSFAAIVLALLIAPVEKLQNFLSKYIKGKVKIAAITVFAILMIITFPNSETSHNIDTSNTATTTATVETTDAMTESTTAPTTEATAEAATEATTVPTTEPTTAPTTEPTTVPTAAPTTAPPVETTVTPTTAPVHTHSFSKATCVSPKTCACGVTEGKATGHDWREATCTEPKTCAVCGTTSGSTAGHNFSNGKCKTCGKVDPQYTVQNETTYVLNVKSKKFHKLSCSRLPTENREDTTMSRAEIIAAGYDPCGYCHP